MVVPAEYLNRTIVRCAAQLVGARLNVQSDTVRLNGSTTLQRRVNSCQFDTTANS